jgi:phosphate transport system substrate-binding protein
MDAISKEYKARSGINIQLHGGGATQGIRQTVSEETEIGGACRPCKPEMTDMEKGVIMTLVAWDALVAIVHPENTINSLTTEQIKKIFKGDIGNWKKVGGENSPIEVVVRRGKISGVGYMARMLVFGDGRAGFSEHAIRLWSSGPVEKKVENTRNAIAITGISSARKRNVKILELNDIKPSKENVSVGKYPLFRPLFLITKVESTDESVAALLDWILSDEGQEIISNQGTVNLKEGKGLISKFKYWENTNLIRNFPGNSK